MTTPPKKPRYDLEQAKKVAIQIGTSCVRKAWTSMPTATDTEVRKHIRQLFMSLTVEDFAHTETMRGYDGAAMFGDVYGKTDEFGLWFIKVRSEGKATTIIMSCHEAEHAITLASGRRLTKKLP